MVVDAVRAYFEAVNGLTELTRKRAVAAAKVILKAGEERFAAPAPSGARSAGPAGETGDGGQRAGSGIQTLAGELIETSQANREALNALVGSEVERALERMELVSRAEYDRLARRVAELERRLAAQRPLISTAPIHAAVPPVAAASAEAAEAGPLPSAGGAPADAADGYGKAVEDAPAGTAADADAAGKPETSAHTRDAAHGAGASAAVDSTETETETNGEAPGGEPLTEADQGDSERSEAASSGGGAGNGQATAKRTAASAKSQQQRSTKAKSGSGRSGAAAKSGGAKRPASRGKNSTKNDQ
ncbi:accessory factor UbiK family protein [Streptomonospora alba]|uniref:accessory factor UbiK family protein n=1 Tax=Streptomonospora alba TaxID=183763 RepID=UPI00069A75E2|nr:hypothetical protein [Streptomonospora alba]